MKRREWLGIAAAGIFELFVGCSYARNAGKVELGKPNFYYNIDSFDYKDEENILEFLKKPVSVGFQEMTLEDCLSQGCIPNIKYELSYSNELGNLLKLFGVDSEMNINIRSENGLALGLFNMKTVAADYEIRKTICDGSVLVSERFKDIKKKYFLDEKNIRFDTISRMQMMFQDFEGFLSHKTNAIMPITMLDETHSYDLYVSQLGNRWFAISSTFQYDKKDKTEKILGKADGLIFMSDSGVGLPFKYRIWPDVNKDYVKGELKYGFSGEGQKRDSAVSKKG